MERTSRLTIICGLPDGRSFDALADVLTGTAQAMPGKVFGSLTHNGCVAWPGLDGLSAC
ncbi:MAG: hypothetical protein ACLQDY_22165 [Streptosporangiaceae bacterium]